MPNALPPITPPEAPDAFTCPYAKPCFQRELLRWIVLIVLSVATAWFSACAIKVRAPGINVDVKPDWPEETAPAVRPSTRPAVAAAWAAAT